MVGVVANDFLSRTLQRDCPAIATALTSTFAEELRELDELFSQVTAVLVKAWHFDDTVQPPALRSAFFFLLFKRRAEFHVCSSMP